jgi:hypothetical protein
LTIFATHTRAREARADSRTAFSFFSFRLDGAAAAAAAELPGRRRWPPAPPLRRDGSPPCSLSGISGRGVGALHPLAGGSERRGGAGDLFFMEIEPTVPAAELDPSALPRLPSYRVAAAGRPRLRWPLWPAPLFALRN